MRKTKENSASLALMTEPQEWSAFAIATENSPVQIRNYDGALTFVVDIFDTTKAMQARLTKLGQLTKLDSPHDGQTFLMTAEQMVTFVAGIGKLAGVRPRAKVGRKKS